MPIYTIDDVFGDERPGSQNDDMPTYVPTTGNWDPAGGTCSQCGSGAHFITPIDASKVHSGTWHTTSMDPGDPFTQVSIPFTGTWVAAYILLPPYLGEYITSSINLTFLLDDDVVGSYERPVSLAADWTYNFTAFSSAPLSNTQHNLTIQPQPGTNASFLAFDYVAYNFVEPTTSSSPPGPSQSSLSSLPQSSPLKPLSSTSAPTASSTSSIQTASSISSPGSTVSPTGYKPSGSSIVSLASVSDTSPVVSHSQANFSNVVAPTKVHTSAHKAAIVGPAVGGVVLVLLFLTWCLVRRSRNKRSSRKDSDKMTNRTKDSLPTRLLLHSSTQPRRANSPIVPFVDAQRLEAVRPVHQNGHGHRNEKHRRPRTTHEELQQRREELEEQLSTSGDLRPDALVGELRAELETLRRQIEVLQTASYDEPPPSYFSNGRE